jgi:hypothetical protein
MLRKISCNSVFFQEVSSFALYVAQSNIKVVDGPVSRKNRVEDVENLTIE